MGRSDLPRANALGRTVELQRALRAISGRRAFFASTAARRGIPPVNPPRHGVGKKTAPLGGRSLLRLVEVARIELASGSAPQSGLHA
jgi:hypothetical protein